MGHQPVELEVHRPRMKTQQSGTRYMVEQGIYSDVSHQIKDSTKVGVSSLSGFGSDSLKGFQILQVACASSSSPRHSGMRRCALARQ